MAGYSGTPLAKKLGIKEGDLLVISRASPAFRGTLGELPPDVTVRTRLSVPRSARPARPDVIVAFLTRRGELERRLPQLMEALDVDGGLWIAWPKRASGVKTDVTEDTVRDVGVAAGMVDNKVCAIDETWSGLRLVYRRAERPAITARRALA